MSQRIVKLKPGETLIIKHEEIQLKSSYSITEASQYLNFSRNKVYRLIKSKKLQVFKDGSSPKISLEALNKFKKQ